MQANSRIRPQVEIDKRKEKERKREEKELRKIAAANGIRMPKPSASTSATHATTADTVSSMDIDGTPVESPKKGGWATVSSNDRSNSASGINKSGWAAVGESSLVVPQPPSTPPPPPPDDSNGYRRPPPPPPPDLPPQTPPRPMKPTSHPPSFHAAGRMSLDTGSSQTLINSSVPAPANPHQGQWTRLDTQADPSFALLPPTEVSPWPPLPDPPHQTQSPSSLPAAPPPNPQPARSNWQQFQKGIGRKK